jgi:hypothetical protein
MNPESMDTVYSCIIHYHYTADAEEIAQLTQPRGTTQLPHQISPRHGQIEGPPAGSRSVGCGGGLVLLVPLGRRVELEGGDGEGAAEPGGGAEDDLGAGGADDDLGDGDPDEELLALDPGETVHPAGLHEGRHLPVVPDLLADGVKGVGDAGGLAEPDEARGAVVAHLVEGWQREEPVGEAQLHHELAGLARAQLVPGVHLRARAVVLDQLRHLRRRGGFLLGWCVSFLPVWAWFGLLFLDACEEDWGRWVACFISGGPDGRGRRQVPVSTGNGACGRATGMGAKPLIIRD